MFAEAPIDSDIFLSYVHHNFPQFSRHSIESCSSILDELSFSDSEFRFEQQTSSSSGQRGGGGSPLTKLYSFSVSVRGTLLGLPSPVERDKQVLKKSEWWDRERERVKNRDGVRELLSSSSSSLLPTTITTTTTTTGGDGNGNDDDGIVVAMNRARGNEKTVLTELIPFLGLMNNRRQR